MAVIIPKLTILFVLILHNHKANSENSNICDGVCLCRYDPETNQDIHGEFVDCSYKSFVLKTVKELPITVHSLDLTMNNITSVQKSNLLKSRSMRALYLNKNRIKELNDVFELPELRILDLSDNQLEFIHEDTFKGMKNLELLGLANNMFKTFDKLMFHHLSNLQEINLNNNKIGPSLREVNLFDRNGFGLTNKIKNLSIRSVGLNRVPDNFFVDAYDLKQLVISNNNLTEIFEIPFTLEYLDLSDNPITILTMEDFVDLPGLKVLKLNNLRIKEIAEYTFSELHGIIELELERNRNLTDFSPFAFGKEVLDDPDDFQLESLSLKASRLKTLDEKLVEPFGQLIHLDLQGNPWKCDCNLIWMKKLQIHPEDYEQLRCATPLPLYNTKIFELDAKYFVCTVERHIVGLSIAVIAFCLILTFMALWFFVFLPKHQSRCNFIQNMNGPSTAYTVLPLGALDVRDSYDNRY